MHNPIVQKAHNFRVILVINSLVMYLQYVLSFSLIAVGDCQRSQLLSWGAYGALEYSSTFHKCQGFAVG